MQILANEIAEATRLAAPTIWGRVVASDGMTVRVAGLAGRAGLGDIIVIDRPGATPVRAEVVALDGARAACLGYDALDGVAVGARAVLAPRDDVIYPTADWLGRLFGPFDPPALFGPADCAYRLNASAPAAAERRKMGDRIAAGYAALDTFLPLCRGQRIGLFAGSGVGKSTLLGGLVSAVDCDAVVVALIGERGREVRAFVEDTLSDEGRARAAVIASTADHPPLAKLRAAHMAMATAEALRDEGRHVLLVFDSLTRYAEAHREAALAAGETPSLRAFPPSTFRKIAGLVERAGPGPERSDAPAGDITAVFSVLVAGSDHEEPVADMIRGILDGHIVLERSIAERGRHPAIDVLKSVSRALPNAAAPGENALLTDARFILKTYEEMALVVRSGLYAAGSDPAVDRALALWPQLDAFLTRSGAATPPESFAALAEILRSPDDEATA